MAKPQKTIEEKKQELFLKEHMEQDLKLSKDLVKANLSSFAKHKEIRTELIETLRTETFPKEGIKICGMTAKEMYETADLSILDAYHLLVHLREDFGEEE